jgi:hypothetical protein
VLYDDSLSAPKTRQALLDLKRGAERARKSAAEGVDPTGKEAHRSTHFKEVQFYNEQAEEVEERLQSQFIPGHGPRQFLNPQAFFTTPLFRVRSKSRPREDKIVMDLPTSRKSSTAVRYQGPELRQADGLVFLALLHMMRDVQIGTVVKFSPEAVCLALWDRYDGSSRRLLCEHIQRLQQGLVIFERVSVQLCMKFEYPRRGGWSVGLDHHIIKLFETWPDVWLEIQLRLALPAGMATWLYGFVASQTRLIPMKLSTLRTLCGSDANDKAFANRLRDALRELASNGIIDIGWRLKDGYVRWRKPLVN